MSRGAGNSYRIGQVSKMVGISADTLRYYEKIELLQNVNRSDSGIRLYSDKDISRLRFIQRAQKMQFRLKEIAALLSMREDPQQARAEVRLLTQTKLDEIEGSLRDLKRLHHELQLLLNLCKGSEDGCPIIEGIDRDV